jgi:ABC-type phosphate transport system substrate-binding protein
MRASPTVALAVAFALVTLCASVVLAQPPPVYLVIVNPKNPSTVVSRGFLEDAFLKKITRWPNDEVIRPVDLVASSPVRRRFTEDVLSRSVEGVKGYWQQRIFSGRDVPPPELDTDEDIVRYVVKHEAAVGYVSGSANIAGTKVVKVQ